VTRKLSVSLCVFRAPLHALGLENLRCSKRPIAQIVSTTAVPNVMLAPMRGMMASGFSRRTPCKKTVGFALGFDVTFK
jgi:hypothetical protein